MSVTGIIAEYNPFHMGHCYHLQKTKEHLPDNPVIVVMSGHFLQRGEPALLNKWVRAEMAIAQGADLVIELPVLYSCRSAYWFARGGLELLQATGIVTHFSFGAETGDLDSLKKAADFLAQETAVFKEELKQGLKQGLSFPQARAKALERHLGRDNNVWSKPNNILALTYLQVCRELNLPLIPFAVERKGLTYNETELVAGEHPSATAIRSCLNSHFPDNFSEALENLREYLPSSSMQIIKREYEAGRCPVSLETLALPVLSLLRRSTAHDLKSIIEVTEGLESRLLAAALKTTTLTGFLAEVKTKRFTFTRLQRFLVHLLLNYTRDKEQFIRYGPPYLRVLAFSRTGQKLLKMIKKKSGIPLIIKGAQGKKLAGNDPRFKTFWDMDILATNLYSLLYPAANMRRGGLDYLTSPYLEP